MVNRYVGLHRGPIDHKSSSVINQIANGAIDMGSVVALTTTIDTAELLPRVEELLSAGSNLVYGIAVGGDTDGIYGDGTASADDSTRATAAASEGVVVVTQGRCPARVTAIGSDIAIGDALAMSGATIGVLTQALTTESIIAIALNTVVTNDLDIIAVDVQREGVLN